MFQVAKADLHICIQNRENPQAQLKRLTVHDQETFVYTGRKEKTQCKSQKYLRYFYQRTIRLNGGILKFSAYFVLLIYTLVILHLSTLEIQKYMKLCSDLILKSAVKRDLKVGGPSKILTY